MNTLRKIIVLIAFISVVAFVTFATTHREGHVPVQSTPEVPVQIDTVPMKVSVKKKNRSTPSRRNGGLRAFMEQLAKIESDNNPRAINRYGMLGKYQFSPRTLRLMGFDVSHNEFLENESLQDSALIVYMKQNRRILRRVINQYDGTWHRGVYITKSGILASAHLVGSGGVRAFFEPDKHQYATADANGTTVELYMKKFANYHLGF